MNKIIKTLPSPVSRSYLDKWLESNVDKKDLEENLFDGHGFYKDGNSSFTVYVVKNVPLVFFYNPDADNYTWKILLAGEWTKWKETVPHTLKMRARF